MLKQNLSRKQSGFTLVEVLIVIIVLGILLSLSYFAFNSWRDRVAESEVKSDLNGLYSGMESARNWNNGYPVLTQGAVFDGSSATKNIFTQSNNVKLTYYQGDSKTYCVDAVSKARPSVKMFLDIKNGNKEPKKGTCAAGGEYEPTVSLGNSTNYQVTGIAVDQSNGDVYFRASSTIYKVSKSATVVGTSSTTPEVIATDAKSSTTGADMAVSGSNLYAIDSSNNFVKYNLSTKQKTVVTSSTAFANPKGSGPAGIFLEGSSAYVGNISSVYKVDLNSGSAVAVFVDPGSNSRVAYNIVKDGTTLYMQYNGGSFGIYEVNLTTGNLTGEPTYPFPSSLYGSANGTSSLRKKDNKLYFIANSKMMSLDLSTKQWNLDVLGQDLRGSSCWPWKAFDLTGSTITYIQPTSTSTCTSASKLTTFSL